MLSWTLKLRAASASLTPASQGSVLEYSPETIPEGPAPQFYGNRMNDSCDSDGNGMSEGLLMGLDAEDEFESDREGVGGQGDEGHWSLN